MPVDLTKLPFNAVPNPHATDLTAALTDDPVTNGYVVITLKGGDSRDLAPRIRDFAEHLRETAADTGFDDVTAYRQLRREELGGAVPFDQAFCERLLEDVSARKASQSDRFPGLPVVEKFVLSNDLADWVVLVVFASTSDAQTAVKAWKRDDSLFSGAFRGVESVTVDGFENTKRYANVSRDPDAIQFFNLFPGPGDREGLWAAWQEVLPRYFDVAGIRSSFPLVGLDPEQPVLLVNYAHADSMKYFLLGMVFDPNFLEDITRCYVGRGFAFPHPFFCKIVPV